MKFLKLVVKILSKFFLTTAYLLYNGPASFYFWQA